VIKLKWFTLVILAMLMALVLSPIQSWLSLVTLPNNVVVVATRGGIFNGSGVAEFAIDQQIHTAKLNWQWCPSLGLTNWCVAIKQAGLELNGSIAYWGRRVVIKETRLSVTRAYQIPGLAPMMFDLEGAALIDELIVDIDGCGEGAINSGTLTVDLSQAWFFGSPVGAVMIDFMTKDDIKSITAKGDSVDASIALQANEYNIEAVLTPPPSLYSAMSLLLNARIDQNGVWKFNQQGAIPC
jgi:hypothetical protein